MDIPNLSSTTAASLSDLPANAIKTNIQNIPKNPEIANEIF